MGNTDLLSVKEWSPGDPGSTFAAATAEQAFTTSPQTFTAPAATQPYIANTRWRFVRIEAHDGDLIVTLGESGVGPAVPNGGGIHVRNGSEVFQLPGGGTGQVQIVATAGTVHGAVIWGR